MLNRRLLPNCRTTRPVVLPTILYTTLLSYPDRFCHSAILVMPIDRRNTTVASPPALRGNDDVTLRDPIRRQPMPLFNDSSLLSVGRIYSFRNIVIRGSGRDD